MIFLSLKAGIDFFLKLRLKFNPISIPLKIGIYLKQYFVKTISGDLWFRLRISDSEPKKH